ncbi:alanine racemase [Leisingera caerulea]|uniref:alanine racemase n=1 Tax=Leisingera caerulea TaxID=506591 RepID=UPI0021A8A4DE|nr:alanine racemase [Leisingera caerulea]UWQ63493.1 alanine racemase [Leisingera caerulea]
MPDICPASWCTVHRDRISRNLELALGLVPKGRRFCAVLKADAYGHGIQQVVPLVQEQGVTCIGITSNSEARAVRQAGFNGAVIRLRAAAPQEIEGALEDRVEEQVASRRAAQQIRASAKAGRYKASVHLSLNAAGMSRDGLEVSTEAGKETCREILDCLGERIGGICTHFPSNDRPELQQSSRLFQQQVSWVFENSNLKPSDVVVHAGSSLTLISETAIDTDMYRCGAILYGILKPELGFRSTMDLEARVVSLQDYPEGSTVGYDREHRLNRARRLACIAIGYENGFRRLSRNGSVVVGGRFLAPVIGKISMNAIVADVTGADGIQVGDTVSVFGGRGAAPIRPLMAESQFRTIMADLYTDWGRRNYRYYINQ